MAVLSFIVRTKAALAVFCRALGLSILFGLLASLTSLAVLSPFEHEVNRIHARLIFLVRVMETKQVSRGDYHALNKAKVKLRKVFKGAAPSKPLAIIKYRSRLPGRARPDGGQRLYKLKHNAIVLVFAHNWQGKNQVVYMISEQPRSTASSLQLPRIANAVKGFLRMLQRYKRDQNLKALYNIDPRQIKRQEVVYRAILDHLAIKSGNDKKGCE